MVEYSQPPERDGVLQVQTADGVRLLLFAEEVLLSPSAEAEGGDAMVTYGDMFTYTLVLISIVGLCVQIAQFRNKKK